MNKFVKNSKHIIAGLIFGLLVVVPAGSTMAWASSDPSSFDSFFDTDFAEFDNQFRDFDHQFNDFDDQFDDFDNQFDGFDSEFADLNQQFDDFNDDFSSNFPDSSWPDYGDGDDNGNGSDGNGNGSDDDYTVPNSCPLSISTLEEVANFPPSNGPIVAFGDSLTAGNGAPSGESYVDELSDRLNQNVINSGKSGDTTSDALARLDSDVLAYNPSAVVVWLGGNDLLQRYYAQVIDRAEQLGIEEELNDLVLDVFGSIPDTDNVISRQETFNNLRAIVNRIQDSGAVVVLVGFDGEIIDRNLNNQIQQIARDTDSLFISDVLSGVLGVSSRTSDWIHPNARGYEIVANRIYPKTSCTLVSY